MHSAPHRVRRTRDRLRESQDLIDQAQRLARVGSWEIDLATGRPDAGQWQLGQRRQQHARSRDIAEAVERADEDEHAQRGA